MYLAETIDEVLESTKSKLVGSPSYSYICYVLNSSFSLKEPFSFRYEVYDDYSVEDYAVSGIYDMATDIKYIILNFSSQQNQFDISDKKWKELKFSISQVCQHESIHQCQWQLRDRDAYEVLPLEFRSVSGTMEEERQYLAEIDEIEAYAHDIAMEIRFFYPKKNPLKVLSDINRHRKIWSYHYYKKTFKNEEWSEIKHRLLKKTFKWINYDNKG